MFCGLIFAQRPNMGWSGGKNASLHNGKISGKLVDEESGSELAFANIRLFRKNGILMEGTITDEKVLKDMNADKELVRVASRKYELLPHQLP